MSIRVDTAIIHGRKVYCVHARTKEGCIQVGSFTQGKKVAIRSFKIAWRLLLREGI